jgi:VanZ family protein
MLDPSHPIRRLSGWPLPLRQALVGGATAVLLWISLAPTDKLPAAGLVWDKAEHALAYLVLTAVSWVLFPARPWRVAAYAMAVGAAVEVLQATMGFGRQGDWRDLLADAIGVAVALCAGFILRRRLG